MGLRFRKSITLCKGVRLNIGKTGVSLSAGVPGFRKTIHSNGRVTTSVGIPSTGIYYVDTKNPKKNNVPSKPIRQNQIPTYTWQSKPTALGIPKQQPDTPAYSCTATNDTSTPTPQEKSTKTAPVMNGNDVIKTPAIPTPMPQEQPTSIVKPVAFDSEPQIASIPDVVVPNVFVTDLFEHCDYPIKWIDVLCCKTPPEDGYDIGTWEYLRSHAMAVFDGNVDAMMEIVEHINPYDDLLDYLSDFEFEADNADCFEITCNILWSNLGEEKENAIASVIIRLARDTFALLPIHSVWIHIRNVLSPTMKDIHFNRAVFSQVAFEGQNQSPFALLETLKS